MSRAVWVLAALVGCGDKDDTGAVGDSASGDTASALCGDAPVVTWENFGNGFVIENCQACHASTSADRHGAPEEITFDDKDTALANASSILRVATGDAPTMPPEGGVTDDDRYLVEVWLTCWE